MPVTRFVSLSDDPQSSLHMKTQRLKRKDLLAERSVGPNQVQVLEVEVELEKARCYALLFKRRVV